MVNKVRATLELFCCGGRGGGGGGDQSAYVRGEGRGGAEGGREEGKNKPFD